MTTPTFGAPTPQPEGDLAAPRTLATLPAQGLEPLEALVTPEE